MGDCHPRIDCHDAIIIVGGFCCINLEFFPTLHFRLRNPEKSSAVLKKIKRMKLSTAKMEKTTCYGTNASNFLMIQMRVKFTFDPKKQDLPRNFCDNFQSL